MPSLLRYYLLVLLLLATPASLLASDKQASIDSQSLLALANDKQLHLQPGWRSLLHYQATSSKKNSLESQVDDDRFFLADNGKLDSQAEIQATILALFDKTQTTDINQDHPRCRFVEREHWLRQQLALPKEQVPQSCSLFHEWRDRMEAHSMTLVFPASYLNSPSSMFGHTLFRFDPENIADDSSWLSFSLSFAADLAEQQDDSFSYAFKGIAGGYTGRFNVVPYFKKLQEYGAIENRDVWEYALNLTPEEVNRVIGHAWELRDIRFDYYFFKENCAFRLLELLDYARPSLNLTDQFRHTAIPAETVKAVVNAGIVLDVKFRPSVGSILQQQITQLPRSHQTWVKKLYEDPLLAESKEFESLERSTQREIITTSNQYLTYRSRRTKMSADMASRRFQMLKQVNRFPAQEIKAMPTPPRPDSGHDTVLLKTGIGEENDNRYGMLGFRISYHDLLDNSRGYLRGGEIQLSNIEFRHYKDDSLQLQRADLIQLKSLGGWHTIFNTIAWEVGVGLRRHPILEDQKLGLSGEGAIGKSSLATENTITYGLIGANAYLYDNADHNAYINPMIKTGLLNHNPIGTLNAEVVAEFPQRNHSRYSLSLTQNIVLSKNHALRITAQQNYDSDYLNTSIMYRYHL